MGRGRGAAGRAPATAQGPEHNERFSLVAAPVVSPVDNPHFRTRVELLLQNMLLGDAHRKNIRVVFGSSGSHTDLKGAMDRTRTSTITLDATYPKEADYGKRHCAIMGLGTHEVEHEISTHGPTFAALISEMNELSAAIAKDPQLTQARDEFKRLYAFKKQMLGHYGEYAKHAFHHAEIEEDVESLQAELEKLRKRTPPPKGQIDDIEARLAQLRAAQRVAEREAKAAAGKFESTQQQYLTEKQRTWGTRRELLLRAGEPEQLRNLWNILEDGRMETQLREREPLRFRRISLLNRVAPRIPEEYDLNPAPNDPLNALTQQPHTELLEDDGYVPVDVDGRPLRTQQGPDGTIVSVPPGTKLPVWTDKPLSKSRQIEAALLAEALPEFQVGDLHPDVQACFDECRPYVDRAVRGNTADAVDSARHVQRILKKHGLVRDPSDMSDAIEQNGKESGDGQGQGQSGGGGGGASQAPSIPMDDEGNETGGEQQGGGGQPGGDQQGGTGDQEAEGNEGDGSPSGGGGTQPPLKKGQRERSDKKGKGRVSDKEAEKAAEEARKQGEADKKQTGTDAANAQRKGDLDLNSINLPGGQKGTSIEEIRVHGSGANTDVSIGEQATYGRALAEQIRRLEADAIADKTRKRIGHLDRRRLAYAPVSDRVFKRPGHEIATDLDVLIEADLSGSMSGHRKELAKACSAWAYAARLTRTGAAIYGFDSQAQSSCSHYEFKTFASDDTRTVHRIGDTSDPKCRAGGGTPLVQAIEFGSYMLAKRRNTSHGRRRKEKALVIMTDGSPTDGSTADAAEQVRRARNAGQRVIGVFFNTSMGDSSSYMNQIFGQDWVEIKDMAEFPRVMGQQVLRKTHDAARR